MRDGVAHGAYWCAEQQSSISYESWRPWKVNVKCKRECTQHAFERLYIQGIR